MNTDHAVEFLSTLEPGVESHEFYWSGLHPTTQKRLQAFGTLEEMVPRLVERNAEGYGIFICVNAIRVDHTGGFARRKVEQVERIRAVFADWDRPNDPVPPLPIPPTMIVGTSPGKFHLYWCVDDFPIDKFEQAQRGIAQLLGSDRSVVDPVREMRLPGFLHTKDLLARTPVRLLQNKGARYGADEILGAFPFREMVPKFTTWDGKVTPGARMTQGVIEALYPQRADGAYNVPCPWEASHTTPSNPTSTIWYPPSEQNAGKGYFKCLHHHCQDRYADHFDDWIASRVAAALGGK